MFNPGGGDGTSPNVLLSTESKALTGDQLTGQARLAESLLRLDGALYETLPAGSIEARAWSSAVVLQINYQVENREALAHEMIGDRQITYRKDRLVVSPAALQIVGDFLSEYVYSSAEASTVDRDRSSAKPEAEFLFDVMGPEG